MTPEWGPFHNGERLVQERAGEQEAARRNGVIIASAIPARAVPFLKEQRVLAIGGLDEDGFMWASVLFGERGFAWTDDGRSVALDRTRLDSPDEDPIWRALRSGASVGLLAIEFETRRRLRINGVVGAADGQRIEVSVRESYPNCRKYIQRRYLRDDPVARQTPCPTISGSSLDADRLRVVERADTFFVASSHPTRGADVSHRGGSPGFVRVTAPGQLRIPDYAGNSMFNTLGNLMVDNRAGLVFIDFERGRLLRMSGKATVAFDEEEDVRQPTGGTGRYWHFDVARWVESPIVAHVAWKGVEPSPHNPGVQVQR